MKVELNNLFNKKLKIYGGTKKKDIIVSHSFFTYETRTCVIQPMHVTEGTWVFKTCFGYLAFICFRRRMTLNFGCQRLCIQIDFQYSMLSN